MRKAAFALFIVFTVSWFLHLSSRIAVLGAIRADLLLVCAIGALIAVSGDEDTGPAPASRPLGWLIAALGVYVLVTLPFVQYPGSVLRFGLQGYIKAVVFYFFSVKLLQTPRRLGWYIAVFLLCEVFRVLEPLYLHQTAGYWGSSAWAGEGQVLARLSGAPSDTINPNGLAFVILTALTFFHYLAPLNVLARIAYLGFLPAAAYALVLTGSRTGIVGLAVLAASIWWKSKRKVLGAVLLGVALVVVIPRLSLDTVDRYLSIVDQTTRNAATARGRWEGIRADIEVAMRRPFFGHGLGTSAESNWNFGGVGLRSHNLYAEVAQELGFVGLTFFIGFLCAVAYAVWISVRRLREGGAGGLPLAVANATQVWLIVNVALSPATYGLLGFHWYLLAGLSEQVVRLAGPRVPAGQDDAAPVPATAGSARPPEAILNDDEVRSELA